MSVILGEWSRHVSTGSMHYASESQWQLRPQSAELVGNALSTLLVWKQIHQKNKKWNLYFFLFLIYLFQFVYTPTDIKPLVVVWNPTRYPQFGSFVLCLLKKITPFPFDSLPDTLEDSLSSRNFLSLSGHWIRRNESLIYVSMYIGMFRPKKRGENFVLAALIAR